jgi:transposase
MFKAHVQDQSELFPPRVGDLIPDEDLCRVVSEVVDRLDLSSFALNYSILGQNAFSPRTMLKLMFYGYAIGVRSSRSIAHHVEDSVRFRWLAGQDRPGKSAIADFRKRNLAQIEELFIQVILLCREIGMLKFGHWAIDGTKLKANAGKNANRKREAIEQELLELRKTVRQALAEAEQADADDEDDDERSLPPALRRKQERAERLERAIKELDKQPDRKRASTSDPDAPMMKRKGGGFEPSYNPQLTVDADSQLVVAADVCNDQNDCAQLQPQLEQAKANAGGLPEEVSADTGYASGPNLAALEEMETTGFIPPLEDSNKREEGFARKDFRYEPEADHFICPAGRTLTYVQTRHRKLATGKQKSRVYRHDGCASCELATRCLKKKAKTRSIEVSEHEELIEAMRQRCSSERGKTAYAKRKQSVEPVFGVAKWAMGFRSFLLRGAEQVRGEWRLAMTSFNIRKIWTSGKLKPQTP